jgi:hypothetical protein
VSLEQQEHMVLQDPQEQPEQPEHVVLQDPREQQGQLEQQE